MRYAVALAVVAVAWAAAVYIHQRRVLVLTTYSSFYKHSSWEDPVAVLLAVGGVAVGVGIVTIGRRGA